MLAGISLPFLIAVFVGSAAAIAFAGVRLAHVADTLADRTGMGEIIAGAVFVGASTSLPGVITSVTTALDGYPQLSIANALGGLTAQTTFLVVADIFYRRANLEHAAASATALAQATLLMTMLAVPLLAMSGPQITLFHVHPASLILFAIYAAGVRLLREINAQPMWRPVRTTDTASEEAQAERMPVDSRSDARLWLIFIACAGVTAVAGYFIGQASIGLVEVTGISQTAFGTLFTAVATSLPELVTAIAAVRIGALNLAFGDVIGGNAFEVLFLAAADFAYLDGSIYAEFTADHVFLTMTVILMTGVLLLGLLHRERHGIANIGWEGAVILGLYAMSATVMFL
ncbi:MAG TPA: sodium:calcium antiporter [Paracoccaceae bacterium]|nr:sodium:calcium antiporter [Paracoccaceae bacterium]